MRKYDWARKKSAFLSFGVPIGALAVVAGCAGGGTVAGTRVAAPAAPIAGGTPAPTIPVTILINPPARTANRKRVAASRGLRYQVPYTTSGVVKIGVTAFVGSSTPSPGPTETVFTLPAPISSASPSPYPVTVNVPIGSDTFVIHEYNGSTGSPDLYPNGYLLSTYTSASPVPIYLNATNRVAIATVPVVTSLSFYPTSVALLENQAAAQTTNVNVNLADAEGNTIIGTVANPVTLQSATAGVLSGASVAVAQTTAVPIGYPAGSHTASAVTATVNALPGSLAVQPSPLPVNPDFYLFFGQIYPKTHVDVYEAATFLPGYVTTPAATFSVPANPHRMVGAQPACGGIAQVLVGMFGASTISVGTVPSAAGAATVVSPGGLVVQNTEFVALNPGSCTGYTINDDGGASFVAYLYSIDMAAGTDTLVRTLTSNSTQPRGLAIDASASTAFSADGATGYLYAYPLPNPSASPSLGFSPTAGVLQVLAANGHEFVLGNNGYLYGFATVSGSATSVYVGANSQFMIASPDGTELFVASNPSTGSTISYLANGAAVPTGVSNSVALPTGLSAGSMVVSPDGQTLYVAATGGFSGSLLSYPLANVANVGLVQSASAPAIPYSTISLAISP